MARRGSLVCLLLLVACDAGPSADPVVWPALSGKADRADGVPILGALDFVAPVERVDMQRREGWTIGFVAGSTIDLEVTHAGTSRGVDLALALYGPVDGNGERALLASDDDSGYGRLPRLDEHVVATSGEHLVVLAKKSAAVARYRLEARCDGACEVAPARCDVELMAGLRTCMEEVYAESQDPEAMPSHGATYCTEDELLGRVRDGVCADEGPALCALPFERFYMEVVPDCRDELLQEAAYADCVLGDSWYEALRSPYIRVLHRERLDATSTLDAAERARVVEAVRTSSHDDVTTAAEAFERVDEGVIDRYALADVSALRSYVAYIYGAGDNTYGLVFGADDDAFPVHDGDIDCADQPGPVLHDCRSDADCDDGLVCLGMTEAAYDLGRCAPSAGEPVVCHGERCTPAWLEQTLRDVDGIPIVGSPMIRELIAYGLGDYTTEVEVDVSLEHARAADMRVVLVGPGGREVVVATGVDGETAIEVRRVIHEVGPANGRWRLRLEGPDGAGTLHWWRLRITSER